MKHVVHRRERQRCRSLRDCDGGWSKCGEDRHASLDESSTDTARRETSRAVSLWPLLWVGALYNSQVEWLIMDSGPGSDCWHLQVGRERGVTTSVGIFYSSETSLLEKGKLSVPLPLCADWCIQLQNRLAQGTPQRCFQRRRQGQRKQERHFQGLERQRLVVGS